MSVTAFGIESRQFGDDNKHKLSAQVMYLVTCSDKHDGPEVAAAVCPPPNTSYSGDFPGLTVSKRDAKEFERTASGGVTYKVTVDYASTDNDPDKDKPPLERPPIVRLSFDTFEETAYTCDAAPTAEDADGNAVTALGWRWGKTVVNSAGRPFDPSITDSYRDPVFTIQKNLDSLPWDHVINFVDRVNDDDFHITYRGNNYAVAEGQAWLFDIQSEPRFEDDVAFEEVTYIIKIRKDGWQRKILDQGLEELYNGDKKWVPIYDNNGDPVQQPALLDGKGEKLGTSGKPVFLKFPLKERKSFGDMHIT